MVSAIGRLDALRQALLAEFVHQEADGAAVHAVDAFARAHRLAQRLQQEAVAAERHDDVGLGDAVLAVDRREPRRRAAGVVGVGGDEGEGRIGFPHGFQPAAVSGGLSR